MLPLNRIILSSGKVTIPQFQSETEIVQSEEQRDIGKLKVEVSI